MSLPAGGPYNGTTHPGLLAGTGSLQVGLASSDYLDWSGSSGYQLSGGPDGDDDFDGLSNFSEYAFGLDPKSGAIPSPLSAPDGSAGSFTYTRRKPSLSSINYTYESSTTLAAWDPFTPPVTDGSDNGDPVETVAVTIPAALLAEPRLFLRVKASLP